MFSYRHAFHAGNHADVLKHTVLIAVLRHLMQKEASIQYVDTHAGAGLYRLDGDYAEKSGEAAEGVLKVMQAKQALTSPIVLDYVEMVKCFNSTDKTRVYPGSPFIIHQLLRHDSRDRLKLYELHPTDHKALVGNVAQLEAGRWLRSPKSVASTALVQQRLTPRVRVDGPELRAEVRLRPCARQHARQPQTLRDRNIPRVVPRHPTHRSPRFAAQTQIALPTDQKTLASHHFCHRPGQWRGR